jgi:membrane protease YdiL (CAAX protease family)
VSTAHDAFAPRPCPHVRPRAAPPPLPTLLLVWFTANFAPHAVVYALTGQLYFALDPVLGLLAELSIMLLNLALPLIVLLRWLPPGTAGIRDALAWHWRGWRTLAWGVAGLIALLVMSEVVNRVVGSPPFPYGGGVGPLTLPRDAGLLLVGLGLWWGTTLGEEVMFRGYLQTALARAHGAVTGLAGAALLFALRHLPADLYWGWHAGSREWLSRLVQLGLAALILGALRHKTGSTATTWVTHLLLWLVVILIS